jgi:hypothetical protein
MQRANDGTFGTASRKKTSPRESSVRSVVIYCCDLRLQVQPFRRDQWPDDLRLSDVEARFWQARRGGPLSTDVT